MISVIVPCYNYGRFLTDAVHSIVGGPTSLGEMGQTFADCEVVIVDDASQDDTREIGAELASKFDNVQYVRNERNLGTAATINHGIERANGEYIHVLSADDMRDQFCLEKMLGVLQQNPGKFVYGDIETFSDDKKLKHLRFQKYDFEFLIHRNFISAGILYPRKAWIDAGGYPESMRYGREDWAFAVALGVAGWCGVHCGGLSGCLKRRHAHNRSKRNSGRDWNRRFYEQMQRLFPDIYRGVRPVGCCGGKRTRPKTTSPTATAEALIGADGMVTLEYIGDNVGTTSWYGDVTGQYYRFGNNPRNRIGNVAAEDAEWFLGYKENRKHLFKRYEKPESEPEIKIDEAEAEFVNSGTTTEVEPTVAPEPIDVDATSAAIELAHDLGLDINAIDGTGKDGRILKGDVDRYFEVLGE